jgi:proline utilization trans-activator
LYGIKLPSSGYAKWLFAAQFTYIGTIFSFVDPVAFERQLQEAYQGPPDPLNTEACLAYCKVLVILAFGELYSINQGDGCPPGFHYFTHALNYLPDLHEEPSVLFVETLSLVGYFMQNLNRRDAAFLYVGTALRMAISLALHQEVRSSSFTNAEKEHRRRVWWSVYSLDRILSVKSGSPIMLHDEDIGIQLPSKLPHEPPYCPAVVLRHYTELSRILSRVMIHIYRKTPKSGSSLMTSVQSIMSSLLQWFHNLPQELRFDPEKLNTSRESVSTLVHYYQCINMTVRPLLFHVVQKRLKAAPAERNKNWKDGLSTSTEAVIKLCISAAHDTIAMMTVAKEKNLLGKVARSII